jgi:hypothetical protein
MGWASYNEDIVSRWMGSRRSQRVGAAQREPNNRKPHSVASIAPAKPKPNSRGRRDKGEQGQARQEQPIKLKDFVIAEPRPLPVIILANISGSMAEGGKIDALNEALANMLRVFSAKTGSCRHSSRGNHIRCGRSKGSHPLIVACSAKLD